MLLLIYGFNFGMAYQIIDDTLDYQNSDTVLGKDRFNDLNEGKMTLPLILTKQVASPLIQQLIDSIMNGHKATESEQMSIFNCMKDNQIFQRCHTYAYQYIDKAKQALTIAQGNLQHPAFVSFAQLCDFIVDRHY